MANAYKQHVYSCRHIVSSFFDTEWVVDTKSQEKLLRIYQLARSRAKECSSLGSGSGEISLTGERSECRLHFKAPSKSIYIQDMDNGREEDK